MAQSWLLSRMQTRLELPVCPDVTWARMCESSAHSLKNSRAFVIVQVCTCLFKLWLWHVMNMYCISYPGTAFPHLSYRAFLCISVPFHTSYIYKNTNLNFSWLKNSFLSIPVSYNTTKVLIDWISTVATQTKEVRHFCGNSQLVVDTIFTVRLHSSVFLVCLAWIKHHFCFGFSEWIDFIRGNSGSPKLFHNFERHRPTEEVIWHKGFGLDFHENWNTK